METVKETIEWRLVAVVITFTITYLWTGGFLEASGLTIALNIAKTAGYYLWSKYKKGHFPIIYRKLKYALSSRRKINQ